METDQNIINDIKNTLPELINKFGKKNDSLIPILQGIQSKLRFIPKEAISLVSKELSLYESDIYGVITFYTQFRLNPVGKHIIKICKGTACHVGGAETIADTISDILKIKVNETTEDKKFTLEYVACLGCCSLAPVMMIDETIYGYLTKDKIKMAFKEY